MDPVYARRIAMDPVSTLLPLTPGGYNHPAMLPSQQPPPYYMHQYETSFGNQIGNNGHTPVMYGDPCPPTNTLHALDPFNPMQSRAAIDSCYNTHPGPPAAKQCLDYDSSLYEYFVPPQQAEQPQNIASWTDCNPQQIRRQVVQVPIKKRKKPRRDPNEPQKPVSAYALFFRDTQAAIKGSNPNASFGEVSRIVAAMWDKLDSDSKAAYKQKTEQAKKDYLKRLAAYRACQVSKGCLVDGSTPDYTAPGRPTLSSQSPDSTTDNSSQNQSSPDLSAIGDKSLASLIAEPTPAHQILTATTTLTVSPQHQQTCIGIHRTKPSSSVPQPQQTPCHGTSGYTLLGEQDWRGQWVDPGQTDQWCGQAVAIG